MNQTDHELEFSYEFEAVDRSSSGSGEGLIAPCTAMTESWSEIIGTYAIMVDGEVVHEGRLEPGQGDGASLVLRIAVGPDGRPALLGAAILAAAPPLGSRPLAGCG